MRPKSNSSARRRRPILLLALADWAASHGLSANLAKAGFEVCALFPPSHVLGSTRFVDRARQLNFTERLLAKVMAAENVLGASIRTRFGDIVVRRLARVVMERVREWQPEFIIPVDERALRLCRDMAEGRAGPLPDGLRALLARSLGDLSTLSQRMSRTGNYQAAMTAKIAVPSQIALADCNDWREAASKLGYPLVVKRENSAAGEGVTICFDEAEFRRAVEAGPKALRYRARLKHLLAKVGADRSAFCDVTIQQYVSGVAAMREVFCWDGEVIAGFSLEKTRCHPGPSGPASVVKRIENESMADSTAKIVKSLGLSGFADVDFIVDPKTERAYCLELNPRPTALTHLGARLGCDLGRALHDALSGEPRISGQLAAQGEVIAVYPREWWRDETSAVLQTADHDVPWDDPGVVDYYARRHQAGSRGQQTA